MAAYAPGAIHLESTSQVLADSPNRIYFEKTKFVYHDAGGILDEFGFWTQGAKGGPLSKSVVKKMLKLQNTAAEQQVDNEDDDRWGLYDY